MTGEGVAVPVDTTSRMAGRYSPRKLMAIVLYATSVLLLTDAVISFVWHRPAVTMVSAEVADYVQAFATAEAMWSGGGNLVAAVGAAAAARLVDIGNQWGRTVAIVLVVAFGFYRLMVLFDMLGDMVAGQSETAPSAGVRLILGLLILPGLAATTFLLANRSLTRAERHRALTGADARVQPPQVRELALLMLWYGIAWLVAAVIGFMLLLLSTEYGLGGVAMAYMATLFAAVLGCVGGLLLGGCGLALWLGNVSRVVWRAAGVIVGAQLGGSMGFFLWESVPRIGDSVPATNGTWLFHQITDLITAGHLVFAILIAAVLWSPRVSRYFRSQR